MRGLPVATTMETTERMTHAHERHSGRGVSEAYQPAATVPPLCVSNPLFVYKLVLMDARQVHSGRTSLPGFDKHRAESRIPDYLVGLVGGA